MKRHKITFLVLFLLALGSCWLHPETVLALEGKKIRQEGEQGKWVEIDPYAPAPSTIKGWTPYAEPVKDWSDPAKRHPEYPWVLKETFPFKTSWPRKDVPYTGEELVWFKECQMWGGESAKTQEEVGYSATMNRRGLVISKGYYNQKTHYWDTFDEVLHYKMGINGLMEKNFFLLDNPPEVRGLAQVSIRYNNAPGKWKDPDRYTWIPALRRVRRTVGGDRQDDMMGFPVSNDDFAERQLWEYTYEIIAEDVLYETNGLKEHDILGDPKDIAGIPSFPGAGVWGDGMNPYREDGGLECWVVKMTPKDPNYYLGYILFWIEKYTKVPLRQEQYDHEGNLVRTGLGPTTYRPFPTTYKGMRRMAWGKNTIYDGDWERDFWVFGWFDKFKFGIPIPETKYTVQELRKEYFWRPPVNFRPVTRAEHFPPYVPLYEEKKHKDRAGVERLDPKLKAKATASWDFWKARGGYDPWGWALGTKYQDLK